MFFLFRSPAKCISSQNVTSASLGTTKFATLLMARLNADRVAIATKTCTRERYPQKTLGRTPLRNPGGEPPSENRGKPPQDTPRRTTLRSPKENHPWNTLGRNTLAKPIGEPPLENPRWGHPQKTRPAIPTYHRPRPQRPRRTCRKRPPTPQLCRKRKAQAKGHPNHPEPPSSAEAKGNCRRPWLLQFRQ